MTGNRPMGCASCRPVSPATRGVERMSMDDADDHLDAKSMMNARRMSTSTSTSTSVTHEGCADDDDDNDVDEMRGTPNSITGASRGERRRSDAWWLFHGGGFGSGAGLDDEDDEDGGVNARIGSAVMDIVPRRDGGETRRRIEMEHEEVMRRYFNADADGEVVRCSGETRPKSKSKTTSKTIQELVRDARETTRRTWMHVHVTTSRGARVVGRALEATASRGSALVEESGRAARFAAREEHRRTVIATARHGARAIVREVSGIKVKIEPIVRVTFDKYAARELGWRLRAAFAASRLGRIFQRRRRGGKRERMKKIEKNAPSAMKETDVDVASPERVYMRDLMGMFEAARGIDPDEFIELLSPQSLTTNAGDMPVVRAEDSSVPTPETVEILAPPVDVSRVESEGYFGSYSEDSFSDTVDEHLPASASALAARGVQSSDVAMSPDPEAKSFVRRIEDDLEALSESEGYSSRILSVDDVTLGAQVLRAWRSALSPGRASAASAASPSAVDGTRLFDDDDEEPVEISRLDVSETNIAVVTPAQDVSTPDQQRAQRVFSFISDSDEFEQLLEAVTPSSELSALEARVEHVEEENAAFVESTFEEQRAVSARVEESISSPQKQVVDEAPSAAPDAVREQTDAFGLELARLQEEMARMRDEQANISKAAVERESELRRSFEVERQRIIDSSKAAAAAAPEQSNEIKLLREELERVKQAQESRVSEPIPETNVSERELAEIATLKREIEQLKKAQEMRASDASKASVPEQSAEIALLKEALDRMKQSQESIIESAVTRERELKETFEKERREFEKSLKESLAAERIELEQELNKSIALERGGLEEQLHQGDEYLGNEIQQIQAELSAVRAHQESASKQLVDAGALSVATPEPPRFALDTETDVSMEWDLYQLKEELDKVKTEQTSALLLTASRDEELRKSLSTERVAIQDAIREEVSRHLGQIEMQSVNAALQVDLRASRAEKMLSGAEKIMEETERKLQQRERQLLANAEGVVARAEDRLKRREAELKALAATPPPRSPFSNSTPSSSTTNLHVLEQARARRRLLHKVTDTFSLGDIVSQARQLAEDIEYSFGQ